MARILVVYFSQTGNTKQMAELVAEGAGADDHDVTLVEVRELNIEDFPSYDAYALGSPDYFTYVAGEMKTLFDRALSQVARLKRKPVVTFVSHGGGGGAIEYLDKLAKSIGLAQVCDGVKCQGAPEKQSADACRELGKRLSAAVD